MKGDGKIACVVDDFLSGLDGLIDRVAFGSESEIDSELYECRVTFRITEHLHCLECGSCLFEGTWVSQADVF